jgi:hypothetical protein
LKRGKLMFTDTKLFNFNFIDMRIKDIYSIRSLLAFDRNELTPLSQTSLLSQQLCLQCLKCISTRSNLTLNLDD